MTYGSATSLGCVGLGLPRSPLSRLVLLFGCLLTHQQVLRARVVLGGPPCVPSSAVAADLGSAADLLILYCTICWPFLDLWCVRVWLGFDRLRSD